MPKKLTVTQAFMEANELLRSAHSIATRRGAKTNWDAFLANVEKHLTSVHPLYRKTLEREHRRRNAARKEGGA